MKWIDYREKLGIGFNDKQKYVMLKNKISVQLENISRSFENDDYSAYAIMTGEPVYGAYSSGYKNLMISLYEKTNSFNEFLSKYMALYNTYGTANKYTYGTPQVMKRKEMLLSFIKDALTDLDISFEIYSDNDGIFIFPKGVKEFDNALVSEILDWLRNYPNAEKAWSNALRDYAECKPEKASDVADKFRKALEIFFKEFFGNDKTLENNKAEYGRYLKSQGVPAEISNNLETLLQAYANFMNGYAKHHDKTEMKVLEYLMYQTGNIMRLLITLKAEADSNAN